MSILPKIDLPKTTLVLPFTGVEVEIRPYTVKEEKILLVAMESITEDQPQDEVNKIILSAVNQILSLTTTFKNSDVKVENLPFFETELLFIKTRAISDNNMLDIVFTRTKDDADGKPKSEEIKVSFDLNDVEVDFTNVEDISGNIQLTDSITVKLRFPTYSENELIELDTKKYFRIEDYVVSIKTNESLINRTDIPDNELQEFFDSLPIALKRKMEKFFEVMPQVHVSKEINLGDEKHTVELNGLKDFFA
jgi:hypothetical protein